MVVFLPMLAEDDHEAADRQSAELGDDRVVQRWSAARVVGDLVSGTLGLTTTAWDVYLVYPPGVAWDSDTLPPPTFWMHQLSSTEGADQNLRLDPESLSRAVEQIVESCSWP